MYVDCLALYGGRKTVSIVSESHGNGPSVNVRDSKKLPDTSPLISEDTPSMADPRLKKEKVIVSFFLAIAAILYIILWSMINVIIHINLGSSYGSVR